MFETLSIRGCKTLIQLQYCKEFTTLSGQLPLVTVQLMLSCREETLKNTVNVASAGEEE